MTGRAELDLRGDAGKSLGSPQAQQVAVALLERYLDPVHLDRCAVKASRRVADRDEADATATELVERLDLRVVEPPSRRQLQELADGAALDTDTPPRLDREVTPAAASRRWSVSTLGTTWPRSSRLTTEAGTPARRASSVWERPARIRATLRARAAFI